MRNVRLPANDLKPLEPERPRVVLGLPLPEVTELDFNTGFDAFLQAEVDWHLTTQETACPN